MLVLLSIAAATPSGPPHPAPGSGAFCRAVLSVGDDEVDAEVPASCPEPFRSAVETGLLPGAPAEPGRYELQVHFVAGRPHAIVQPATEDPSDFARPARESRVVLPDDRVDFKRASPPRFAERPSGRPVTCHAVLDFDLDGRLESASVRACPPPATRAIHTAVERWRVVPRWLGVPVAIRTAVSFSFTP